MAIYRAAARKDANQPEIVRGLRAIGASVHPISGKDIPDLLVGWKGKTFLLEVKGPKGKLKPGQFLFHTTWPGGPCEVVRSVDEALAVLGIGGNT